MGINEIFLFRLVPPSKMFVHVNPVQISFHLESVLWLNSFALNLHKNFLRTSLNSAAFEPDTSKNEPNIMYMDVKVEAIMLRVSLLDVHLNPLGRSI